jgi:hypothetical protein
MSMMTREIFTKFGFGLNQFRVYLQKFKQKSEKKKGKEKRKKKRALGADFSHSRRTAHGPVKQNSELVSSPLYFLADAWAPPVKPRWLLQPRPKLAPGDCAIPRFNPRDLFPISPPPRVYKNPSLSHTSPLENPSETAARLLATRADAPQSPTSFDDIAGEPRSPRTL